MVSPLYIHPLVVQHHNHPNHHHDHLQYQVANRLVNRQVGHHHNLLIQHHNHHLNQQSPLYYKRYCANSNIAIDQSPTLLVSTAPRQVSNPVAHRISITGQAIEVSNPMTNRITTSAPTNTTIKIIKEV